MPTKTHPRIMGILNVTPDSFSDGGQFLSHENAIKHAFKLMDDGADILDIGGESTRPNSLVIQPDDEQQRVIPVIKSIKSEAQKRGVKISIDTRNASTMRAALDAGADIINDVSALTHDGDSLKIAAASGAQIVLMHMLGTPQTMQENPVYKNVVQDVFEYLQQRINACVIAGIPKSRIIADPGLGFGKTVEHNIALLTHAQVFQKLDVPILIGASRKRFLTQLAGQIPSGIPAQAGIQLARQHETGFPLARECLPENIAHSRLAGSLAAAIMAVQQGAQILRVHDVFETKQALTVWQGLHHIDKPV